MHDFSSIQHFWKGLRLLRIQTSYIQICWDTQTFRGDPPRFLRCETQQVTRNSQKAQNARAGSAPKLGRGAKSASRGARRRGAWTWSRMEDGFCFGKRDLALTGKGFRSGNSCPKWLNMLNAFIPVDHFFIKRW